MVRPWKAALFLGLLVTIAGCKGKEARAVDPAAPAGDVRTVTGAVVAVREGARRGLAVDDVIAAGDEIQTGPDGDVVIELRHNHVRWHLGPDQTRRPIDAAAWTAAPPTETEVSGERTAVAGRHAEREGADTSASSIDVDQVDDEDGDQDDDQGGEPRIGKKIRPKVDKDSEKGDPPDPKRPPDESGGGGSGCDEVGCLVADRPPACCSKFRGGSGGSGSGGSGTGTGASSLGETLTNDDIKAGVALVLAKAKACGDKYPDAADRVKVKIQVSPSGSVTSAKAEDGVDAGLGDCVADAMRGAKFEITQKGGSFTYPVNVR